MEGGIGRKSVSQHYPIGDVLSITSEARQKQLFEFEGKRWKKKTAHGARGEFTDAGRGKDKKQSLMERGKTEKILQHRKPQV